jgi:hypothetical protein
MKAIHVTHKSSDPKHLPRKSIKRPGLYESDAWVVSEERAEELKGSTIYMHQSRDMPSFDGGEIIDFEEVKPKIKYIRVRFFYRKEKDCIGISAPKSGWRNEYRIVK